MIYVVDTSGRSSSADGKAYLNDGAANPITSHTAGGYRGLDVVILDGSGNQVTTFGGTQYTEDDASAANPVGGALIARRRDSLATETTTDGDNTALNSTGKGELYVKHVDAVPVTDNSGSLTVDNGGTFAVQDSQVIADNAGFTDGTSKLFMGGFIYDETAGTALTENDAAAARVDSKRAQVLVIEDAAIRGRRAYVSDTGSLYVAAVQSGTWSINAVQSGSWTVDTELPAAASLTDSDSNYTAPTIGGALMLWDQGISKWFRARGTLAYGILSDVYRIQSVVHVDDNSGSLTVDNAGTFAVQAAQSGNWSVRAQDGSGNALTSATRGSERALSIQVVDASGNQITAFNGGAVTNAGTFAVQANYGATGTLSNVSGSATSVTLLASNANRRQAIIVNDSTALLYVKFGATASTTSYTYKLKPDDTLEVNSYTGKIDGIWTSATGTARVTEVT